MNKLCICDVCGDACEGHHYGALCCAGCKAFFRRSIRCHIVYVCDADNQCEISTRFRNCCRSCRFQKCIAVGMNPSSLQRDRGRINRRLAARKTKQRLTQALGDQDWNAARTNFGFKQLENPRPALPTQTTQSYDAFTVSETNASLLQASHISLPLHQFVAAIDRNSRLIVDHLVRRRLRSEASAMSMLRNFTELYQPSLTFLEIGAQDELSPLLLNSVRAYLNAAINEAHECEVFARLSANDKLSLLRGYIPQNILLSLILAKIRELAKATHEPQANLKRERAQGTSIISDLIDELVQEIVPVFVKLNLDIGELSCFFQLLLWNPACATEATGIEIADKMQRATMALLQNHIDARPDFNEATVYRFSSLLFAVKQIQEAAKRLRQYLQLAKSVNLINKEPLIDHLLLAAPTHNDGKPATLACMDDYSRHLDEENHQALKNHYKNGLSALPRPLPLETKPSFAHAQLPLISSA